MDMQVVSALAGTLIGVTATGAITWINQKTLNRRELIRDEFRMRQTLYGEFIAECAKLLVDAYQHSLEKPDTFVPVYALINRIRLCASLAVLTEAEQLVQRISEQYFSNNLSVQELRQLARSAESDALKSFGEACRPSSSRYGRDSSAVQGHAAHSIATERRRFPDHSPLAAS